MNKKNLTKIVVFLCLILLVGAGYLFIIGDKNKVEIQSFKPDADVVEEKIVGDEKVFVINDEEDGIIEVSENSYLIGGNYKNDYENRIEGNKGVYVSYLVQRNIYEDGGWKKD